MVDEATRRIVPVPVHRGRDVGVGVIRAITREVGITPDEWNEL